MIRVNLVPPEILAKAKQKQQAVQAAVVGLVIAVLVAGASAIHVLKEKRLDTQLVKLEADLKKLAAIVAQVEELERQAAAVRARLKVITDLKKGRTLYPIFMSDFVRTVPAGVYVKTMNTATASNTLRLTISAESRSSDEIAGWVKNMLGTEKFSSVEMGAVTSLGEGAGKSYNFTLTCGYNPKL